MRRLLALIGALALAAGAARAEPAMWVAHGAHARMVLFGSLHMLPKGVNWEPPALAEAVAHADEIWFETPLNGDTFAIARQMVVSGRQGPGKSLFDQMTPAQAARLRRLCERLGLPTDGIAGFQPWLADVVLSAMADVKTGADPASGVEMELDRTTPASVKREALETAAEQVGFLSEGSQAEQVEDLDQSVKDALDHPDFYEKIVRAWLGGDLRFLNKAINEDGGPRGAAFRQRLITDRNRRWVVKLAERLNSPGTIVVVVGAGHLVGPDGVPALLRARGIAVDGPLTH
jgi:uncharacterized protein